MIHTWSFFVLIPLKWLEKLTGVKDIAIVKVETGIVTLISYHHYLQIVGNNKLWPHMQKESWNIHGTKILICSINTLNGTESQPSLEQKRSEGYIIVSREKRKTS